MSLLQVWAIFAKFGEIHLFSPPKNLRKFRQPLDASRGHLTKPKLQKYLPRAQIISSNTWRALLLSKFRDSENSFSSRCRFLQNLSSISPVAAVAPCALCLLLIPAPYDLLEACGRRRRAGGGALPRERRQQRLCGRQRDARRRRRHPAPPKPSEVAAWPSTPQNALPLSS